MLKHLSIIEMSQLIKPWVSQPKRKATFLSIPEIAGLHPKAAQLYGELVAAHPADASPPAELRAVMVEADAVDLVHDALARATHCGLVAERAYALASKPPAVERARKVDEALVKLFPAGLAIVNASLLAEAGNTVRVAELLDREPAIAELLESIPVKGFGTLAVVVQRWLAAGKKLAKLEEQREDLEADQATVPLGREAQNHLRARWIRLVSHVLSLLELSDADPRDVARIRNPILKASGRAGKRYGAPAAPEEALVDTTDDVAEDDDVDVETAVA